MTIFNSGTKEIKKLITIPLLRSTKQNVKNGYEIDTSFLITYNMYHLMHPNQIVVFCFILCPHHATSCSNCFIND
jgi:hypothetical protein